MSSAADFLTRLAGHLEAGDATAAAGLFHDESHWRDLLPLTWSIATFDGPAEIAAMLAAGLPAARPRGFALEEGSEKTVDGITEAWFRFETEAAQCRGQFRLKENRAWTLMTAALSLKAYPERIGTRREPGVEHGAFPGRPGWALQRRQRHAALGDSVQPYCLIIGGGQNGLSLAARLAMLDVPTLVVDRHARPGDAWRQRYDSLYLHDTVWANHLPYLPFPPGFPTFIPKDRMGDWLDSYARIMDLDIWNAATAEGAEHDPSRGEWRVQVTREGREVTLRPKQLVIATGLSGAPATPRYPGAESFRGTQMHSSQYRSGAAWRGKRCVVVGSNNSAHDICADLWEQGAEVTMVQRSSTLVIRAESSYRFLSSKLYSEEAVAAGISTEQADFIAASRPYAMLPPMHRAIYAEIRAHDAAFYAALEKVGFMLDFGEDESGHSLKYLRRGSGYYIDVGASQLIIDGAVKLRSNTRPARILPEAVELEDGTILPADLIVYATGFEAMETWVEQLVSPEAARRLGPLWGLGSGTRRDPGPWAGELRNMWKPTRQEGLWIQGGNLAQARFYSRLLAIQIKARMEGIPTPVHDPRALEAVPA
ncbi:FAD-dependent oxidoreductase [Pseudoroseomonas deserti]|uniref:FAD-dependent oxidoreductase n=1 Tax=Teichococcus deserti TaxID=1817963 RepID=A0A1V2H6Z4_9PROT|nr:NAD(P)/FAD-dependent oxidoreductase [Pseudoroseomonas deserti]ONG58026.1 FAD-dependent oxidoreductase [Pseudoroseomonas deserti]